MSGPPLEPVSLERRLKYLMIRGVHRVMTLYPYEGRGRGVDPELEAAVREREQHLIVAPSLVPDAGMGLFADRDYDPGEVVCTYIGAHLSLLQMLRTRDWTYMMDCGKDRRGERVHLDARHPPRTKAAYVNHHFDPAKHNIYCDEMPDERKSLLLASRRIQKGEELYMDYGAKYWHIVTKPPEARAPSSALSVSAIRLQFARPRVGEVGGASAQGARLLGRFARFRGSLTVPFPAQRSAGLPPHDDRASRSLFVEPLRAAVSRKRLTLRDPA